MITLKPIGGLGNRMLAINSIYHFSQKENIPFEIIWEKSFELNCNFEDIFLPINGIQVKNISKKYFLNKFITEFPTNSGESILKRKKNSIYDESIRNIAIALNIQKTNSFENPKELENAYNNLLIKFSERKKFYIVLFRLLFNNNFYFKLFKPVTKLSKIINENSQDFDNTIGVHIRRGDNVAAIKASPLDNFIQILDEKISLNPRTNFYLATDSKEVESKLIKKYGDKIKTYKKSLKRYTSNGIQDAIIDMYSLANTNEIIGSKNSSFSYLASKLSDIPLTLA